MRHRTFGRTGWSVGDVGYGMWGMAGWSGSDDAESLESLQVAVDNGVNFFDTAYAYGDGRSEMLLGQTLRANKGKRLYTATKVPPKNRIWPSHRGDRLDDVFPPDYIRQMCEKSLANIGVDTIDLLQFHVWEDDWAGDKRWQKVVQDLKREKLVSAIGVSINRWEPANAIRTLRTGLVDAVQVIYNLFDQNPEDELFPVCRELNIGVIARVPFDEGSLTGTLTKQSTWPKGDFRSVYFVPANLNPTVDRVDALKKDVPKGMTLPDLAMRFILANPDVHVVIPGMRKKSHVVANVATSDAPPLPASVLQTMRRHRWVRTPAPWSG